MAELFKVLDSKQTVLMFLHSSNQEISCAVEFNQKIRQKKYYKFREHLRSNGFFSGIGSYISGMCRDVSARRYEHGFVWKALQFLLDIT